MNAPKRCDASLKGHGRLRRANDRLVAFQRQHAIATLWNSGDKASADMMSLDASRHLYSALMEPRRRTPAAGIYTHVMGSYGVFHDQPIVLSERQAAPAVHGVETYNAHTTDGIRLSLLAVDTHGYIAHYTRNVKRWKDGLMTVRWIASALSDASTRFRKLRGYRDMKTFMTALDAHVAKKTSSADLKAA